jgi:transcriptional regulator GlxA family with amidase domain
MAQAGDHNRLAGKLKMSRRWPERRLKSAMNATPLGYLQGLRVECAKWMLAEGG